MLRIGNIYRRGGQPEGALVWRRRDLPPGGIGDWEQGEAVRNLLLASPRQAVVI
ncbi:MAG: hypothetical protein MUC60_04530 [Oscillatoria sp. Prado101]|nr:hypothetical protein [Oscillatoria sp. Prado101]